MGHIERKDAFYMFLSTVLSSSWTIQCHCFLSRPEIFWLGVITSSSNSKTHKTILPILRLNEKQTNGEAVDRICQDLVRWFNQTPFFCPISSRANRPQYKSRLSAHWSVWQKSPVCRPLSWFSYEVMGPLRRGLPPPKSCRSMDHRLMDGIR